PINTGVQRLELLGTEKALKVDPGAAKGAVASWQVFSVPKSLPSRLGSTVPEALATFDLSEGVVPELSFRWERTKSSASRRAEHRALRECVVNLIFSPGSDARYVVLRREPAAGGLTPQRHTGSWTERVYTWDKAQEYADTSRHLAIERCRLR